MSVLCITFHVLLQDLVASGLFQAHKRMDRLVSVQHCHFQVVTTIVIDRWLLAFVIVDLLQREMDEFVNHWNSHIIRPSNRAESPGGIPNDLYEMPSCLGIPELIKPVDPILWAQAMLESSTSTPRFYSHAFENAAVRMIKEAWGLQKKHITPTNCKDIYTHLHHCLR